MFAHAFTDEFGSRGLPNDSIQLQATPLSLDGKNLVSVFPSHLLAEANALVDH